MPTISVKKRLLDHHLGHVYSQEQIDELCFDYGLEVDDVVSFYFPDLAMNYFFFLFS